MKTSDAMDIKGRVTLQLRDRQGQVVRQVEANNKIVLSGRDLVVKQFLGVDTAPISHLAVGTSATAVADSDVALGSELFRKALKTPNLNQDLITTGDNRKKILLSAELDFTEGNGALTEAALFNADPGGVMYNRVVFPPVSKTADFKLTLIWEIIF